jgi:hypothetical protein
MKNLIWVLLLVPALALSQGNVVFPAVVPTTPATVVEYIASGQDSSGYDNTTLTIPLTITSASNRVLYLIVMGQTVTHSNLTTIDWNGATSFTLIDSVEGLAAGSVSGRVLWIYRILSPTAASADVRLIKGTDVSIAGAYAVALYNVNQSDPEDITKERANDIQNSISYAQTTASGDLVLDAVFAARAASPTLTAGAGQTERGKIYDPYGGEVSSAISTEPATGASTTMSWTLPALEVDYAWARIRVKQP